MKTGMLWFDDSARALKIKVNEAADYYKTKYGQAPTLCFVNPIMVTEKGTGSKGLELKQTKSVMPHHFWIGIDETGTNGIGNGRGNEKAG